MTIRKHLRSLCSECLLGNSCRTVVEQSSDDRRNSESGCTRKKSLVREGERELIRIGLHRKVIAELLTGKQMAFGRGGEPSLPDHPKGYLTINAIDTREESCDYLRSLRPPRAVSPQSHERRPCV